MSDSSSIGTLPAQLAACALLFLMAGAGQTWALASPLDLSDNYAECVIRQIQPATNMLEIKSIEGNCRSAHPAPSKRGLLGPRSAQQCYRQHQENVSNRRSATALHNACQDYFRRT